MLEGRAAVQRDPDMNLGKPARANTSFVPWNEELLADTQSGA